MSTVMDDSEYRQYSVDEACVFLGCEKEWLWDMCQQRKITHLKRGRRTFFLRRHLIAYLESIEVPAESSTKAPTEIGALSMWTKSGQRD